MSDRGSEPEPGADPAPPAEPVTEAGPAPAAEPVREAEPAPAGDARIAPTAGGAEHDPAASGLAGGLTSGPPSAPNVDLADVEEANRAPGGRARAVLTYLARQIVDEPDGVTVEVSEARGGVRLSLFVADGDMGKVIGRKGRVAQAIRAVVRAAGARDGVNVTVDIVD